MATRKRILIIDDEESFTHLLKLNLEQTGAYEVRVERQGSWGLLAAKEFLPDLIFLDVIMPDMDGGQVAAQIRAEERLRGVPIVFLTAIVSKHEATTHRGIIGGNPFLAKPVSVSDVIACIEKHLGKPDEALVSSRKS